MSKYQTKVGIHGNILLIKTNGFTLRSSENYYLKWKQKDQEYYKFTARESVDLLE